MICPRKTLLALAAAAVLTAFWAHSPALAQQNAGAIGQIVPAGGIVALNGPVGAIVSSVRVKPGDNVKAGDLLMTLQGDILKAEQDLAAADLVGARKVSESQIAAQNLGVELARQRLNEATRELASYREMGARAVAANEAARLEAAQAQARITMQIEQARLESVRTEANKVVLTAAKRVALANGAVEIRAPADGTILKIDRRPGQRLTPDAALQMGDLSAIYVACQVFQGDLLALRPGMKATIRNATLARPLSGTIEEVSRLVETRSRLGEVRIKLDSVEPANRLIGMEVEVVIAR
ncbi:MAG: HlyD family efflux transporter periplasmic adaptor subunit [Alphaproteobacteria bacterium]|nr:HlyD family efflux transporter periplasmic adaptor subunit [Alphaproteobacteria bacterium]